MTVREFLQAHPGEDVDLRVPEGRVLLESGQIRRLLFAATGALMSPTASMQGESIPGICHAVAIETQVNT